MSPARSRWGSGARQSRRWPRAGHRQRSGSRAGAATRSAVPWRPPVVVHCLRHTDPTPGSAVRMARSVGDRRSLVPLGETVRMCVRRPGVARGPSTYACAPCASAGSPAGSPALGSSCWLTHLPKWPSMCRSFSWTSCLPLARSTPNPARTRIKKPQPPAPVVPRASTRAGVESAGPGPRPPWPCRQGLLVTVYAGLLATERHTGGDPATHRHPYERPQRSTAPPASASRASSSGPPLRGQAAHGRGVRSAEHSRRVRAREPAQQRTRARPQPRHRK